MVFYSSIIHRGKRTKAPLSQQKSLFWFKDFLNQWPSSTAVPCDPSTRPMEPPTQENTAEGGTLEMLLMKYNWAHDQLKDIAPANQKKKKLKKKTL